MTSYSEKDTNKVLNQITADTKQIEQRYFSSLAMLMQSAFAAIASAFFVLKINFVLAIISMIFAALSILPSIFGGAMLDKASLKWSNANKSYLGRLKEILAGVDIIKNYQAEKQILKSTNNKLVGSENDYESLNNKQFLFQYFAWLLAVVSMIGPLAFGLYFRQVGLFNVTISTIITLLSSSSSVVSNLRSAIQYFSAIKATHALRQAIIPNAETHDQSSAAPLPSKPELTIKDLSFAYKNHAILDDVSLSLPYGEKLLLSGDSGTGKSTFLNLLTNKLLAQKGSITLGQQQIRANDYAYITQQNWVFDASVRDNLTLDQDFSDQQLVESLKEVNLDQELGNDPLGYQCGEEGKNLSGGQKQRLSIARALLRKRPLLLLDEITAALDDRNFERLRNIIYQLPQTIIEIAHHYNDQQIAENQVLHVQLRAGKIVKVLG
ncbi:ATP-binding cassette domain-containing protein [Oenococcus sicerae]|uniref:ATP-binding cassette domain-containing protein n=1 Tax=Oenococcus sicerae TaxID=2203724 RepID=UPI0039EBD4B0